MTAGPELPRGLRPPVAHRALTWPRWAPVAGTLAVGLLLGTVVGAGAVDPTRTPEYQRLQQQLATAQELPAAADTVSISEGVWAVGRDVPAGTYRAARPVTGDCYWAVTTSASHGTEVVADGVPTNGVPTVELSDGQVFENDGCGPFVPARPPLP
jgi:hypothetical protein